MNESCCFHHFVAAQITLCKFGLTELVEPRKLTGSNPEGQGLIGTAVPTARAAASGALS